MVATSSRILSCGVWLMLMRKMSAPASNRRRIIALSEEAGPRVARILIRRNRLMAYFQAQGQARLAGGQARRAAYHPAGCWANRERRRRVQPGPANPVPAAARAVRWRR